MAPPATAPAAPSEPRTTAEGVDDAISVAFGRTMAESGTPEEELTRDERGRFVPREEIPEEAAPAEAKKAEEPKGAAAPAEEAAPPKAGEPVVLPAADLTKLATAFTLKDAQGELAIPEGLKISFQANGKTREEPLDRVVKFAQMGVYNHEREQRTQVTEARADEVQQYATQVEERLRTREQQLEQLLGDPAFRERAIQEYEAQQTPEMKAQRLEREREQFRAEQQYAEWAEIGRPYYQSQIIPSLDMLEQAVPNVTRGEIETRVSAFIKRLTDAKTGLVPPQRFEEVNQHFLTEIIPWAQSLDDYRATERGTKSGRQHQVEQSAANGKTQAELEKAQVRAAKARRAASANLRPPGRVAAPTPKPAKTPTTHAEIMDDVINTALKAAGVWGEA